MIDPALIEELKGKLKRTADWEYFFRNLNTPDWVIPLFEAGFFGEPAGLVREGDSIQVPGWPPSAYLARVAAQDPQSVMSIVELLPETDNPRIHADLTEVLARVPARLAVPLLPKIKAWRRGPFTSTLLLNPTVKLIVHLAEDGALDAATDLLLDWLSPELDDNSTTRWYRDDWEFGEALDRTVPSLTGVDAWRTLAVLVELLKRVVASDLDTSTTESIDDHSWVWRPAVEDHEQNHFPSNKDKLLVHVRDLAGSLGRDDCLRLARVIEILLEGRTAIFIRLAMNVAREQGEGCNDIVGRFLLDRNLFDEIYVHHEYATLARDRFGDLSSAQQEVVSRWIAAGPDLEPYRAWRARSDEGPPTEDEEHGYVDHWKAGKLAPISSWLSPAKKVEYETLVSRVGKPEHPEFLSWSSGAWVGPTSPLTQEEILERSLDELLEFLHTWRPEQVHMAPSPVGLGRAIAAAIEIEPSRFLSQARSFIGLEPTYVRAVFDALRLLLGQRHRPALEERDWTAVLNLAEWVTQQPVGPERETNFNRDEGWTSTRKEIAHALDTAIGAAAVPLSLADQVWRIIEGLLGDPQPTPDFERELSKSMDPATIAINTVRGTAMHAAFQYLLWGVAEGAEGPYPVADERLEVLSRRLDPSIEPSRAVRSVFGWWFPSMLLAYESWARTHADAVFPLDDAERELFDASWSVYLARWRPGPRELEVLSGQYELAISLLDVLDSGEHTAGSLSTAPQLLGQHLIWFYCTGVLPLVAPLLVSFQTRASNELLADTTGYIGRAFLKGLQVADAWERIKAWWEWRKAAAFQLGDAGRAELGKFGLWSDAADFEPAWYLGELEELVRARIKLDNEFFAVKKLASLAEERPRQVLICLEFLESTSHYPWLVPGNRDDIASILQHALDSGDDPTMRRAEVFINRMAAKGNGEFLSLLDRQPPT